MEAHFFFPFSRWARALPAIDFSAFEDLGLARTLDAVEATLGDVVFVDLAMIILSRT
jgi:hypothetical protein